MIFSNKNSRGYTLIELLIVIAIMGVLSAIIVPSFSAFRQSSALNADAMNLVSLANRARLLSVSNKGDIQYGIHLETGKAVLFQGTTYDPAAVTNETYVFSTGVVHSGTAPEVLFAKITGAATPAATSTLVVSSTNASTTILILPTGIITIE